jgi:hypothetical protein
MQGRCGYMYGHYAAVLHAKVKSISYRFHPLMQDHKVVSQGLLCAIHGEALTRYKAITLPGTAAGLKR